MGNWFEFLDRNKNPYNPTIGAYITTNSLWRTDKGDLNSPDWQSEEWLICASLIPAEQLDEAAELLSDSDHAFHPGWGGSATFDFGEHTSSRGIDLYVWVHAYENPMTRKLAVALRRDFTLYHLLDEKDQGKYYHPVDDVLVAEIGMDEHRLYNPTLRALVHRDYLRDYLAACEMGLLISVVADRFANSHSQEELEIDPIEDELIDEYTWLSTMVNAPSDTDNGLFRGRSILHRNHIIRPLEAPRIERTVWPFYGEIPEQQEEPPLFIADSEGGKKKLDEFGIGYLYFRADVLSRYLQKSGYKVFFHMRNWGSVTLPNGSHIDVGINSQGLVNAFAPHLADLSIPEQHYWASHSVLPSGGVCEELFQTRMQCDPPYSPGVVELVEETRKNFNTLFDARFNVKLFGEASPSTQELNHLSIGPIMGQFSEVCELAKILYMLVVESLKVDSLRKSLEGRFEYDSNFRQIKLLEALLQAEGLEASDARSMTSPLVGLNELRIASSHLGGPELDKVFKLLGSDTVPTMPRDAWATCVDAVINALNSIIEKLKVENEN